MKGFMASATAVTMAMAIACLLGLRLAASGQQKRAPRPNIIFFLVDDMGWQDTSVPFWDSVTAQNRKFRTPNMVRLAARSEKFTDAYANSVCTPSRVSLMTGMNVARHRVTNWTMLKNTPTDHGDSVLDLPQWNVNGLSPVPGIPRSVYATPLFQVLKDHGYFTIHCGKAHFAAYQTPGANPVNLGAMINIGGSAAGNPASYLAESDFGYNPKRFNIRADIPHMQQYWGTPTFLTQDLTTEAIKAIDTARMSARPFFLYMANYAVHLPYDADKRFVQQYLDEGYTKAEAAYCALLEGMDHSLGRLMDYVDAHGLAAHTIFIFMSDNGGYSHPPREGKDNTQNYPLRGGKGSLYEGGVREPMMVDWPGVTTAGSVCGQYVDIQDFFPTVLEMAGIRDYKTVQHVDGQSMVPLLKDPAKKEDKRILVWNFPNDWRGGSKGRDNSWTTSIRQGDWKLIYFEKYGQLQLYHVSTDIRESHDLSRQYPSKARRLARLLTKRLKKYGAQRPVYKRTGKPVPWPDQIGLR